MSNIKKIIIVFIIAGLTLSLVGCEKVFQVKRIDENTEIEANNKQNDEDEKESLTDEQEKPDNSKEDDLTENGSQLDNIGETELPQEQETTTQPAEETTTQALEETIDTAAKSGLISYLVLSDEIIEGVPGPFKKNFVVGEDHFVHLFAGFYSPDKQSVIVEISWKDDQEQIVYKEERMELTAQESNIDIYSRLGLTKRVLGQDKLPDAMGDYWAIIEVDGKVITKTKYSIVAE